ncbi:MAG: hypothetical protein K9J06_15545 [Flavobacteriales bacterium]|nr:hypothetical protein [Flavobacteriales bacterium]
MVRILPLLLLPILMVGCTKCVQCDIELKEAFVNIATIDEYCGTSDDVEEEELRLVNEEFSCIECVVNTAFGQSSSGFLCGDRAYTDSVENDWRTGAMEAGLFHNCTFYRDTLEVTCVLKQ